MNETSNDTPQQKKRRNKKNLIILILMFLLLLCLFLVQCQLDKMKQDALRKEKQTELEARQQFILDSLKNLEQMKADSIARAEANRIADSIRFADSIRIADSIRMADSLAALNSNINRDSLRRVRDSLASIEKARKDSLQHIADSLAILEKIHKDSLQHITDSLAALEKARLDSIANKRRLDSIRASDMIPPNAEITPPAGRYYDPIKLKVKCDEIKCKTYISIGDTLHPIDATNPITYNKTGIVFFAAEDSMGNISKWEEAKYDMASDNICGKNAYPVPVKGKTVCVDAYEYPNMNDAPPQDMVSHEEATKLCEKEGKHLCSLDEWQAACRGKDKTKYTYGNSYKQNKCNTNTNAAKRSGRKDQCRSWYGMYDMNGNLWEWTSTTSPQHPGKYLVAGGAWNTNNGSHCGENKFSFYPQNQYPSVGFRCCK